MNVLENIHVCWRIGLRNKLPILLHFHAHACLGMDLITHGDNTEGKKSGRASSSSWLVLLKCKDETETWHKLRRSGTFRHLAKLTDNDLQKTHREREREGDGPSRRSIFNLYFKGLYFVWGTLYGFDTVANGDAALGSFSYLPFKIYTNGKKVTCIDIWGCSFIIASTEQFYHNW